MDDLHLVLSNLQPTSELCGENFNDLIGVIDDYFDFDVDDDDRTLVILMIILVTLIIILVTMMILLEVLMIILVI